jgi:hypothetical protein
MVTLWHWFLAFTGASDSSSTAYGFWSGFGSDFGELAAVAILWRKVNCHAKGCPRVGLHRVDGTHFVTCRKHHPAHDGDRPATAEQISDAHAAANRE